MEEGFQRDRSLTYDPELLLQQQHNVRLRDWMRKYRHIRNKVYDFLDHPTSTVSRASLLYHVVVFFVVLIAVILGASTESMDSNNVMIKMYSTMETILAVFFLLEFLVRMWAISADAKYSGLKGHLRYLRRFVCITDITIIVVTFVILLIDKRYISVKTMDYLRFVQILRLFHIDRQMSTWRLIKNMVMISRWELFSAYYITFVIFLFMANLIYYTEHAETHFGSFFVNSSEISESPVPTLAHAWWFSVVTILTVGYGDIVPKFWASKVIVCVLGYIAYCTFLTASTQISVGLTLMMEEDNKKEYKNKLRHNAASLIQSWWRYHLASGLSSSRLRTQYFREMCYKLYLTGERLTRIRAYEKKEKKSKERRERKKKQLKQSEWKNPFKTSTQFFIQPVGIQPTSKRRLSMPQVLQRHMSLPIQDLNSAYRARIPLIPQPTPEEISKFYDTTAKRCSVDTTISSSFEGSDSENNYSVHEPSIDAVDEKLLMKYRPLLRFFCYLWFQDFLTKFKRLRKADKLLEMEAEIVEQIHERDQKLNELEAALDLAIGKHSNSALEPDGEMKSIIERLEISEAKVADLTKKAEMMENISLAILQLIPIEKSLKMPQGLPPVPPGRILGRRLQRQTASLREDDETI